MLSKNCKYLLIAIVMAGCKQHAPKGSSFSAFDAVGIFPAVCALDTITSASFVPTMQDTLPADKNVVYTPAFLYAWDELREKTGGTIQVPDNEDPLQLVNSSVSYKGTLLPEEYATRIVENGAHLSVFAAFKKGLPFKDDMDTAGIKFKGIPVKAFGMTGPSEIMADRIAILFYDNDDHFIVRITPADDKEDIILAKGFNTAGSFENILKRIDSLNIAGQNERKKNQTDWRYNFLYGDELLTPVMSFNYAANYRQFTGRMISADGHTFRIDTASQRTAFVINEHGAKVESEAEVAVAVTAAPAPPPPGEEQKHEKKMLFDKDFIVILRKKNAQYPYFMMAVTNTDIMVKR